MGGKSKFMARLAKEDGAVQFGQYNPLLNCLQSPSPSANWAFGIPGHGLPFGYSAVLYGPPKGGKSIICNGFIGQLHRDDPEALALSFNTELRGEVQANAQQLKLWGIDENRFQVLDRNSPEGIFDFIATDVAAACQDGEKIRLIVIDSLSGIQGRRTQNSETVLQQQIGDHALTIKDGLKRIIPVIRKYKIALLFTDQVRAELDPKEVMRGNTTKMGSSWAAKHSIEFFIYVAPNRSKEGRTSLAGDEFVDQASKDFMDHADKTGHKIRMTVKESSLGRAGRTAEFTLDYDRGIVNTYEEVFTMARNLGILSRPNNQTYQYKEHSWRGLSNCLIAIRDNPRLYQEILNDIYSKDAERLMNGTPEAGATPTNEKP
jgi:KaiC/GvpD/RAD55 family RecA-like ATPase